MHPETLNDRPQIAPDQASMMTYPHGLSLPLCPRLINLFQLSTVLERRRREYNIAPKNNLIKESASKPTTEENIRRIA